MKAINLPNQTNISKILEHTDLENMFNVYWHTKRQSFFYNLNDSLYIYVPKSRLLNFIVQADLYWTTISYQIYKTTRLAWLLMKLNNVKPENMLKKVEAGTIIKYLSENDANFIIKSFD